MTIQELKHQQLQELKIKYYDDRLQDAENRCVSYYEMVTIDDLVTDDEVIQEFGGYIFTDDDFAPVEAEKNDELVNISKGGTIYVQ